MLAVRIPLALLAPVVCCIQACATGAGTEGPTGEPSRLQQAAAQPREERLGPFDETVGLRVGSLFASAFDTRARLDSDFGIGTSVRLEDEIDMAEDTDSFRADLYWRIGRRHRIDLGWFDLQRSGTRTIEREIRWGELEFDLGASVTAELQTEVIPLRYTYNVLAGDDHELGVGLGVYGMMLRASMQGQASAGSGGSGGGIAVEDSETFRTPVPLPVFAVQGGWALADGLRAVGLLQYFYVDLQSNIGSLDRVEGSILDASIGLEYDVAEHACVGASLNWFHFDAMAREAPLELDVQYDFSGLYLYLGLRI